MWRLWFVTDEDLALASRRTGRAEDLEAYRLKGSADCPLGAVGGEVSTRSTTVVETSELFDFPKFRTLLGRECIHIHGSGERCGRGDRACIGLDLVESEPWGDLHHFAPRSCMESAEP